MIKPHNMKEKVRNNIVSWLGLPSNDRREIFRFQFNSGGGGGGSVIITGCDSQEQQVL